MSIPDYQQLISPLLQYLSDGHSQTRQEDRAAMATAVERPIALLDAAIEANDRVLFNIVGAVT